MTGWIAPTDRDWFDFLASGQGWEEVNFWRPSDYYASRAEPGAPFLFKLKAPFNAIAGFGYFVRYDALPEWLAWECFGPANGAPTFDSMKSRLDGFRARNRLQGRGGLEQIGCIVLSQPVFFPQPYWTPQPTNWPPRNLGPMRYDLMVGEGQRVWEHCLTTAVALGLAGEPVVEQLRQSEDRWGEPVLMRPRLGQAAFRLAVTEAYSRACAMTGEHSLPALESCHIRPFALEGPHEISNGLLLRSDLHRLFDKGT